MNNEIKSKKKSYFRGSTRSKFNWPGHLMSDTYYFTITLNGEDVEVVDSFQHLDDMISASGGCRDATTARLRSAWGKFCELLPLLTSRRLSLTTHGHLYQSYIRIAMLYGCEMLGTNCG